MLLLHGSQSHAGWWGPVMDQLARRGFASLAYDRAGWGRSPGEPGHLASYDHFLDEASTQAVALRQRYGVVHLAGMSWGGLAALYLALRRGWLFDSLTLVAPGIYSHKDVTAVGKTGIALGALARRTGLRVGLRFAPADFTADPARQADIAADQMLTRRVSAQFCIETMKMRAFCARQALRQRIVPSLCLLAEHDAITDNAATIDFCHRADIAVRTLPGTRHALALDAPDRVADMMAAHCAPHPEARPPSDALRVWVVGAGAVGGTAAALLSHGGVSVDVLAKEKYVGRLRERGITLRRGTAQRTTSPEWVRFGARAADLTPWPDMILFAVKSFDMDAALASLRGEVTAGTILVCLQNGVDNEAKIAAAFPEHTVIAAAVLAGLGLAEPGVVDWPDDRGGLAGAVYAGDAARARYVWQDILPRTGMATPWVDGPNAAARLKWSKLLVNAGFNAINAATGKTTAQILCDAEWGPVAVAALREGFAVMRAQGLDPVDLPGAAMRRMRAVLRLPTGAARRLMAAAVATLREAPFSMRQDVLFGRGATEVDALNGAIVRAGARCGVRTPANEALVKIFEKKA